MTKRQKVLVATFLLGLVSLGIDCLFLRPPEGAAAASAEAAQRYAVPRSRGDDPVPAPAEAEESGIAARLDRLWPQGEPNAADTRDPFALPACWFASPTEGPVPASDPLAGFARSHALEAVVLDGRQVHAVIGDRFLIPGQQIDGFTLISVTQQSAVFERQGERVTLELANK